MTPIAVALAAYDAYVRKDRAALEALIAEDSIPHEAPAGRSTPA